MNVMDNMLMQMYQSLESARLPEIGANTQKNGKSSFQDLMEQAKEGTIQHSEEPKQDNETTQEEISSDADTVEDPEVKKSQGCEPAQDSEEADTQQMNYVDIAAFLFRPEIQTAVEEQITPAQASVVDFAAAVNEISAEAEIMPVQMDAVVESQAQMAVMAVQVETQPMQTPQAAEIVQTDVKVADTTAFDQIAVQNTPVTNAGASLTAEVSVAAVETAVPSDGEQLEESNHFASDTAAEDDTSELSGEVLHTEQPLFRDVETAPIKVGENYQLDTTQPDMEQKLAHTIFQAANLGEQKIEIQLTPEHLGTIVVEMTKTSDGTLQVVLHAADARTTGILTQNLSSLNQALENLNQNQVQVEVQRGEDSQSAQQNPFQQADPDGRGQQHQHQHQRREDKTASEDFLQQLRLGLFSLESVQ